MTDRVLYCVLNWGLGHASRSIPVIQDLIDTGNIVVIASDGLARELLIHTFPDQEHVELPAYDIRYHNKSMVMNLLLQSKKFFNAIRKEHKTVRKLVAKYKINRIISDSRFGCFHEQVESVIISHQLNILHDHTIIQSAANSINSKLINRFSTCWVPDHPSLDNLSGTLSEKSRIAIPVQYIGPQSRFTFIKQKPNPEYEILAILSGPEPQRSHLQNLLESQLSSISGKHKIVSGSIHSTEKKGNVLIVGMLTAEDILTEIRNARYIISRSGYSSIMDYDAMGIKAILIPTPGQPEQEYLAQRMKQQGRHIIATQDKLDIKALL